jgi:hypothetical protein
VELDLVMATLAVCLMFGAAAFQEVINAAMASRTHILFQGYNFQVGENGDTIFIDENAGDTIFIARLGFQVGENGYTIFIGENRDTIIIVRLGRNRRSTPDKIKDQAERREDRYYVSFEIHYYFGPRQMYFSISAAIIRALRDFVSIRTTCGTHVVSVKRSVAILIYIFAGAYGR